MRMGPLEIVIILVVVLVIFGATKMTQVGQSISRKTSSNSKEQASTKKVAPIRYPRLQAFGFVIAVGGVVLLALSFGLIKAIAIYAVWGAVVTAVGVTMVILARQHN